MKAVPWIVALVLGLVLVWSLRSGAAADQRARDAEARVDSLEQVRQASEEQARADSVALDSARVATAQREQIIRQEREQARLRASRASLRADSARIALGLVLDSLGVSHDALDALERAHKDQLAAKDAEISHADSATAVVRGLLMATEQSLTSERAVKAGFAAENDALRAQIQALKSGRNRDRFASGALLLGAVAVALLR